MATLCFSVLFLAWLARSERNARLEADNNATLAAAAQHKAAANATEAERQRNRAEKHLEVAFAAVDGTTDRLIKPLQALGLPPASLPRLLHFDEERRAAIQSCFDVYEQLLQVSGDSPSVRYRFALAKRRKAELANLLGEKVDAEASFVESVKLLDQLVSEFPDNDEYRAKLFDGYESLARLYVSVSPKLIQPPAGKAAAEDIFEKAVAVRHEIRRRRPDSEAFEFDFAKTLGNLANWYSNNKNDQAVGRFEEALSICDKLVREHPAQPDYRNLLGRTLLNRGVYYRRKGDAESLTKAELDMTKAIEQLDLLVRQHPQLPEYRFVAGAAWNNYGNWLRDVGRMVEAETAHRKALDLRGQVAERQPEIPEFRFWLSSSYLNLAVMNHESDRLKEAIDLCTNALKIREELVDRYRDQGQQVPIDYATGLGTCQSNMGNFLRDSRELEPALTLYDKAIGTLEAAHQRNPNSIEATRLLREAHWNKAETLTLLERHEAAREEWNKAITLDDGEYKAILLIYSASSRLKAGDKQALLDIEQSPRPKSATSISLYQAARAYGRLAKTVSGSTDFSEDERGKLVERYVRRAVGFLVEAREKGYMRSGFSADRLIKNPDFDALRGDEEFKQFIRELENKALREQD